MQQVQEVLLTSYKWCPTHVNNKSKIPKSPVNSWNKNVYHVNKVKSFHNKIPTCANYVEISELLFHRLTDWLKF